jgi:translocation and assembly module TamA
MGGRTLQATRGRRVWLLLLSTTFASLAQAGVEVELEGLDDDEVRGAVRAALTLTHYRKRAVTQARARYLYGQATEEIERALEPFGFYDPRIEGRFETLEAGEYRVIFTVRPGPAVVVTRRSLELPAEVRKLPPVEAAIDEFEPARGERLEHQLYEQSKQRVTTALRAAGYLDAETNVQRVAVDTTERSAEIDLAWELGPRYRLGPVEFSDVQFSERFLSGYVPWKQNDYYSTEALLTLQQRLSQTGYFQTVAVEPVLDRRAAGVVPVQVVLTPNERNLYRAGVYYSTDYGVGGRLGYERRWLNRRGHTLDTSVEYSRRLQDASVTYEIPRPSPEDKRYTFGVGFRDETSDTARSRSLRVAAAESRKEWKGFARTLGLHYLDGDFEVGGERGRSALLYFEGTLGRKHYDDLSFPREGYSIDYGLRLAPESGLTDTSLAQAWVQHKRLLRQGDHSRIILRARLGAMAVGDFDELPPELRFFAGGDRSIRGFDYQAIGELNEQGEVVGGEYLVIATAEYEYYLPKRENWGAAVFTDAGDAFTDEFRENVSVGVGLRWRSPIGMVRVDVATPVVSRFDNGVRLHITIGPDL